MARKKTESALRTAIRTKSGFPQSAGWWFVPQVEAVRQKFLAARTVWEGPEFRRLAEEALAAYDALPAAMRDRLENRLDASPFLDDQGRTAMKAMEERRTFFDLAVRAEHVGELVIQNCPAGDPLRVAFGRCCEDDVSYVELAGMLAAFDALSVERQREILNGWFPMPWPTKKRVLEETADTDSVSRELHMQVGIGGLMASHCFSMRSGRSAVKVSIKEGSSKGDVMAELTEIMEMIDGQWDQLITSEFHVERETAVKVASVPALGSAGNRAMAPTAA